MIEGLEFFPHRRRRVRQFTLSQFQPNLRKDGQQVLYGGVVRSIAQHPTDESEFTVATAFGGLFRSNDGGRSWRHLDDLGDSTNDVAYDRNNPSILLATTNEDFRDPPTGGVWRSTDGGETWRQPESGRLRRDWSSIARLSAFKIAFDPSRAGRVFVATNGGILTSDDYGANWQPPIVPGGGDTRFAAIIVLRDGAVLAGGMSGVWHYNDAGSTWTRELTEFMTASEMNGFAASPFHPHYAFVVTRESVSNQDLRLYQSSTSGRSWSRVVPLPPSGDTEGAGGTAFVKAIPTPAGEFPDDGSGNLWCRLYYGNHLTTYRIDGSIDPRLPSPFLFAWGRWEEEKPCHYDTHDLVFDAAGRPILMATDAGLEAPTGPNAVCGGTWVPIGGVQNGLSALQVADVAGQQILNSRSERLRYDLYIATMHDSVWASTNNGSTWDTQDGPEGGGFQMYYPTIEESLSVITYNQCWPCGNKRSRAGLIDIVDWNGPNPEPYGTPVLVSRGWDFRGAGNYIQHGFIGPLARPARQSVALTEDFGASWRHVALIRRTFTFAGSPKVSSLRDPEIYQAFKVPGTPPEYRLFRISGLFSSDPRVHLPNMYYADPCRRGSTSPQRVSLAYFAKDYYWYPVFAVNPSNPRHLIGVDINSQKMVESRDGGGCWEPMEALTQLVTNSGHYHLTINLDPGFEDEGIRESLVTVISFNPGSSAQVIIGTEQNGMFYSNDGGRNWVSVPNSWQVTSPKAVHWQSGDTIIVASYGRGLWKLEWMMVTRLEPLFDDLCDVIECFVIELTTLTPMALANASFDEAMLISNGSLVDVHLIGDQISTIQTTPGTTHIFATPDGEPKTLTRSLVRQDGNIAGQPQWEPLRLLGKEQVPVGLLLEYGKVKYIFAAKRGITFEEPQPKLKKTRGRKRDYIANKASLSLFGGAMFLGYPIFTEKGEELSLVGTGFKPGIPIVLYLDDHKILGQVLVDEEGSFWHRVPADFPLGKHTVCARQQLGKKRFRSDAAFFIVKPKDD